MMMLLIHPVGLFLPHCLDEELGCVIHRLSSLLQMTGPAGGRTSDLRTVTMMGVGMAGGSLGKLAGNLGRQVLILPEL